MIDILPLLRRHAAAMWLQRWKALALTWVICLLGWAVVQSLPNQYQASARIFADADAVLGTVLRGIALDSSPAGEVEVLQRTLLSRPNLETMADTTGLAARASNQNERELLINRLARDIRISNTTRNLFSITYRDHDPQIAHDIVQSALGIFIGAAAGNDRQQFEAAREFLLQRIAHYEVRLRDAERRRAEFQARYIDLLPSAANGGLSRLDAGRSRLQQLRGELQDARMRRDLTRQQLESAPTMLAAEAGDGSAGGRVAEAERELRELRLRYTEQHPAVASARNLLTELRSSGGGNGRGARGAARPNPVHEQLRARIVDADVQLSSLERQVREGEAEFERLEAMARSEPELQAQFTNLDRDYHVLRRHYEELLARRESIQLADAARTDSDRVKLEVVDPPTMPRLPAGPNRRLLVSVALAAGIGAGIALAFLLTRINSVFFSVAELRRLGLPVLGGVSMAGPMPRGAGWSVAAFGTAAALLFVGYGAVLVGPAVWLRVLA